jgi:hypothetical protein
MKNRYKILVGKPEGQRPLWRPSLSDKITLRWLLSKLEGRVCTGYNYLRMRYSGDK